MDIKSLNENIKKFLKEEQINELSPQTIQNYIAGRKKQADDLSAKFDELSAQQKEITKQISKYNKKITTAASKNIITLFNNDYTHENINELTLCGDGDLRIEIDDKENLVDDDKLNTFSFKGAPEKVKRLNLVQFTGDEISSFRYLPKNIESLAFIETELEDISSKAYDYLTSLGDIDKVYVYGGFDYRVPLDITSPVKTKTLKIKSVYINNDSFLNSCNCNKLIVDDSCRFNIDKLPPNITELYIIKIDDEYSQFSKNLFNSHIKIKLKYVSNSNVLNDLGLKPSNNLEIVDSDCVYCDELQKWFDNKKQMNATLKKLGIKSSEKIEIEPIPNDRELHIAAIAGVEGSISTSITYEEFCKMSKQELKDKIVYYINNNVSDFDCGADIMLDDLKITNVSFDKIEQKGIAKGKWYGDIINDQGSSVSNTGIRVEFELTFEED